nr:hypothetical protein [Streptomyces thermoviolaceus]
MTVDDDVLGARAESEHMGVEADVDVDVVRAGPERQGVALGAELVGLLDGEHVVDLLLDRRVAHGRVEDQDVGSQVGRAERCGATAGVGRRDGGACGGTDQRRHSGSGRRPAEQGTTRGVHGHGSP